MSTVSLDELKAGNIFDLKNVVAVVTGGATGIGLMISSTLIANGATVYVIGPKQADLDRTAQIYNTAAEKIPGSGRMYGIEGDVRLKSEAKRLAEEIGKREPHVTALFNNAGICTGRALRPVEKDDAANYVSKFFDDVSENDFDDVLKTNAVGPYWLTFAFLPLLEKWKNSPEPYTKKFVPQIIMTTSMNGWTKDSRTSGISYPYMFSKSALGHATSSLAHELLPLGIRVNGIAPGVFPTNMSAPQFVDENGIANVPSHHQYGLEIPASSTGGSRKDMGSLALFLVANWFVNGETVLIDGGTLLKYASSY